MKLRSTEEASMYRQRRKKLQRRRRATVTIVSVAVMAMAVGVPTLAAADPVGDLLNNVTTSLGIGGNAGGSGGGGGGTATPDAGAPPGTYTPPLHGSNPHGQGTVGTVDLAPSDQNPLSGDPNQSGEEVTVGDTRGEQNSDGTYHGRTTLANVLGITIP